MRRKDTRYPPGAGTADIKKAGKLGFPAQRAGYKYRGLADTLHPQQGLLGLAIDAVPVFEIEIGVQRRG